MSNPHFTRVDTHRILLIDESSADEGAYPPGYSWRENQGDYIHDVPRPKKVPRNRYRGLFAMLLWPVAFVALVALVAVLKS